MNEKPVDTDGLLIMKSKIGASKQPDPMADAFVIDLNNVKLYEAKVKRLSEAWMPFASVIDSEITAGWGVWNLRSL